MTVEPGFRLKCVRSLRYGVPAARDDLKSAIRSFRRSPGSTAVILMVLGLAIGAGTSIFSVVDAVVLRALPFDESDRLVAVSEFNVKSHSADPLGARVAPQNFLDWRSQQDVFTGLAAVVEQRISLRRDDGGEPETLPSQAVTADFFSVLRVPPMIGRAFTQDNEVEGRARVAVISYSLWQRRFGGAPDVIGRRLQGPIADFEILGVMPPGFTYPVGAREPTQIWVPFVVPNDQRIRGNDYGYYLQVIGRLRDDVSISRAQARMDQIMAVLAAETPSWFTDRVAKVEPLTDFVTGKVRTWMLTLLGAVAFVMLIACVNVANLMLVRATVRTRELGIRSALGASRGALARALLVESLVLSVMGAALGVVIAWAGIDTLKSVIPAEVPRVATIALDLRVLAATAAAAIVTGLIFGMAPMLQLARPVAAGGVLNQRERSSTASATSQWLRSSLVVAEVALAVILLAGSGLFMTSFWRVTSVDLGMNPENVLTVRVRPYVGQQELKSALELNTGRFMNVLERVRAIPGIEESAVVDGGLPLRGDLRTADFAIPGRTLPRNTDIDLNQITSGYFRALDVPLLKGRLFGDTDLRSAEQVAILNEAAARKYFDGEEPLGKVVQLAGRRTIVGVVGNIRHDGPEAGWRTQAYIPLAQSRIIGATLVLRTRPDIQADLPAVKSAVWSEFPDVPLPDIHTLEHYFSSLIAQREFNMLILGAFGLLGVVVAALGLYGVLAYVVTERTREIGIRLALGALPSAILRSVIGRALLYLSLGFAVGVSGAWALARFVEAFLFQIHPNDPSVYGGVLVALATSGAVAAWLPARRAARVDPIVALRYE